MIGLPFAACADESDPHVGNPEQSGPTSDIVNLSKLAADAIGLKVIEVKKQPLPLEIMTMGTIESMPTRTFVQHALLGGRVDETMVELGQQVKAGQVLAILDSPEINRLAAETLNTKNSIEAEIKRAKSDYVSEKNQAQARLALAQSTYDRLHTLLDEKIAAMKSLETARADLEVAKSRLENVKRKEQVELNALDLKLKISMRSLIDRLKQLGVPQSQINQMLKTEVAIVKVPVTSTRGGVVTDVHANPGETINGQDPLFDILDYSIVWAQAEVFEGDMDRVAAGQKVIVKANALPHLTFQGRISHVGSEVDPDKHTLPVRVEIPNPKLRLKPDMFVELFIQTQEPTLAIKVPRDAIVQRSGHYAAFVQIREGTYQLTRVDLGRSLGDEVEINEGLTSGQKVVVRGAFQLDANLLKAQGSTEIFAQPEGSRAHQHEESGKDKSAPAFNPMWIVIVAGAFVLGIGVSALFIRTGGGKKASSTQEMETSYPQGETQQEKSRRS